MYVRHPLGLHLRPCLAHYGYGSFLYCLADISVTVGLRPFDGDKQIARLHKPGIHIDSRNIPYGIACDPYDTHAFQQNIQLHHHASLLSF